MSRKPNFDVKFVKVSGPRIYSSRSAGQGACLKGMSRTITMQGLRLAAITDVKKTKLRSKICQSQWTVKYGSRSAVKVHA